MNTCKVLLRIQGGEKVSVMNMHRFAPSRYYGTNFFKKFRQTPGFGPPQSTPKYLSNTFLYACNKEYSK